jgi:tetratricopeptide (TPR) repeat protein
MMSSPSAELISRGLEARREKRLADARHLFSAAVEHCRKANDKLLLAEALAGLGQIERDEGKAHGALKHFGEAVELLRKEAMEGGWRIRFATLPTSTGNRDSRRRQHSATKRLLRFIAGTNRRRHLNWRMRSGATPC